ncbi:glutathione S-transferase [Arboricoccus pini]|uniref:Glutathione S-transferase n=1 Tax=Arboricoccus pini TaxID=1963835 RepID=A0A212QR94_9PROT|nr:glutathione S-transferase N-terminal domain-containing protein [Arboricoccus pini]SNB62103.1 glutathione S-transferase [Arboricoccus pini]
MKLYYSPGSCSFASHIVLRETGAAFERVLVSTAEGAQKEPAFKAINPRGMLPALDYDGGIMTENAAIMTFLALRYPQARLLPEDEGQRAKCLEWVAWQSNTAQVAVAGLWRTERFVEREADFGPVRDAGLKRLERFGKEIEDWLAANAFAAGSVFSIADPMFLVLYRWSIKAGLTIDRTTRPAWSAYAARLAERPSVRDALQAEQISLFHP